MFADNIAFEMLEYIVFKKTENFLEMGEKKVLDKFVLTFYVKEILFERVEAWVEWPL